jgi:hypothetical protein
MPLELKNKQALAKDAHNLAGGSQMVRYNSVTYIPADYETLEIDVVPDPLRTIWLPLSRRQLGAMAANQFNTIFAADAELKSFEYMVAQSAIQVDEATPSLLVRTPSGLLELNDEGQLVDVTGEFRANALQPMLNEDQVAKDKVFAVISTWLDSDEEAESLLCHLATSLAPGWSAVKYVLLLGEGRNGKGVLLKMLMSLFGHANVSHVTRQDISEKSPTCVELNNKLLNLVFDGQHTYLKDSGLEKTLIAGEPAAFRLLYESTPTIVQTNALFVESLNREPKSNDKSTALQKRLVRFQFPHVYALDRKFEKSMLDQESLGAFLSLLIDRYVVEDRIAEMLAPTAKALELQLEAMHVNSIGLQFLKYVEEKDTFGAGGLVGKTMPELVQAFQSWRLKENDIGQWAEPDVQALFQPLLNTERKSIRDSGKVRKERIVTSLKDEAAAFIKSLEGDDQDDEILAAVVED